MPRVLVELAAEKLGVRIASAWGMTEVALPTITRPTDSVHKVAGSDGAPLDGTEIRVVGLNGELQATEQEGRLEVRGAFNFVGYLKRPELYATDSDGWFDTGDLAFIDADGYVRITGRTKDIVIRGGENIPVVEVENALYRHPAISEVAVISVPDPRLGERACACVTLNQGVNFGFEEMVAFLGEAGLTKIYLPERLEIITEMPRTSLRARIWKDGTIRLPVAAQPRPPSQRGATTTHRSISILGRGLPIPGRWHKPSAYMKALICERALCAAHRRSRTTILRGCDSLYLAANKKLGSDQIATLIEALSLLGEFDACI